MSLEELDEDEPSPLDDELDSLSDDGDPPEPLDDPERLSVL